MTGPNGLDLDIQTVVPGIGRGFVTDV